VQAGGASEAEGRGSQPGEVMAHMIVHMMHQSCSIGAKGNAAGADAAGTAAASQVR
jgi:hypothetical protein